MTKSTAVNKLWIASLAVGLALVVFFAFGRTGEASPVQPAPTPAAAAAKPGPIILYTTSWCGYCRKTRALLTELGETFEDKDIEKSAAAQAEYSAKGKGYTGVPLIDFDGVVIRGYSEATLRNLVAERKKRAAEKAQPAPVAQ